MTNAVQHFGKVINTRQPCVVVFKQLSEDPTNCLVVEYENVPEPLKTMLLEAVRGSKAQNTPELSMVLSEVIIPDTGGVLLDTLHHYRLFKKTPIDNVLLTPTNKEAYLLSDILKYIRYSAEGQYFHVKNMFEPDFEPDNVLDPKKALEDYYFRTNTNKNTHVTNLPETTSDVLSPRDTALHLLQESNNLQKTAVELLRKASAMMDKSQTLKENALKADPELTQSFRSDEMETIETSNDVKTPDSND